MVPDYPPKATRLSGVLEEVREPASRLEGEVGEPGPSGG